MPPLYAFIGTGQVPARAGLRHNMIVPYGVYPCANGQVLFAIQSDPEFRRFCETVLEEPALADHPDYATNSVRIAHRDALEARLAVVLAALPVTEVVARLDRGGIANAVVNDIKAVVGHAQLAARGRWCAVSTPAGDIPALLPPHNLASVRPVMGRVPALGEHDQDA